MPVHLRSRCTHSHFDLLQVETFARQDDTDTHAFAGRHQVLGNTADDALLVDDGGRQMFYGVETLPAGIVCPSTRCTQSSGTSAHRPSCNESHPSSTPTAPATAASSGSATAGPTYTNNFKPHFRG